MVEVEHAPERVVFCSRCGTHMRTEMFGGKPRRRCPACRFIHFEEPKVAVAAMVLSHEGLLLVKRAVDPEKGKWALPAGYLDLGETPREGVAREVLEETQLTVKVEKLVDAFYNPPGGGASVVLVYRASVVGGTLTPSDDASEAAFFEPPHYPELAFSSSKEIAARAARAFKRMSGRL